MKIYTISIVYSNVCEVQINTYTNRNLALAHWNNLLSTHKHLWEESDTYNNSTEEELEGMATSIDNEDHKRFSYDSDDYYVAIEFLAHESDPEEMNENGCI